jgi:hypothetical protein
MNKKIIWSESELLFLRENCNNFTNKELAIKLNKTPKNVQKTLKRLNIRKDIDSVRKIRTRRNKEAGTDLSFEYILSVAKKYNSRGEFYQFSPVCYTKAIKEKWIDKICEHMIIKNISIPQLMLKDILEHLLNQKCSYNNRKVIKPLEIDCYFDKWKIGWEYDGKYFHNVENDKHKKLLCLQKKIHLFNITENTKEYRNYELNIKNQIFLNLNKINKLTNLSITKDEIFNYKIQLTLPNMLTTVEKEFVFGKTMTEIKSEDFDLFKRIKKYKIYNNLDLNIVYDLRPHKTFENINDYISYLKSKNYNNFTELCEKEHPHRLLKKWGIDIKIIHNLFSD